MLIAYTPPTKSTNFDEIVEIFLLSRWKESTRSLDEGRASETTSGTTDAQTQRCLEIVYDMSKLITTQLIGKLSPYKRYSDEKFKICQ